jgi:hypothetical protein
LPLTHEVGSVLQPSVDGDGAGSFAHWLRVAEGFAATAFPAPSRRTERAAIAENASATAVNRLRRLSLLKPDVDMPSLGR